MTSLVLSQLAFSFTPDEETDPGVGFAFATNTLRTVLGGQTETVPSQGNRKATNEMNMNPLLANAFAKKAKKSATSNKRKLNTADESTGRSIVHAPEASSSQPLPARARASSSQPNSNSNSLPPTKKFRADSQPILSSHRAPSGSTRFLNSLREDEDAAGAGHSDTDVERDVRAMEDEADRLRRSSRANFLDPSILPSSSSKPSQSSSQPYQTNTSPNPFAFPPPSTTKAGSKPPSKAKPPSSKKPQSKSSASAKPKPTSNPRNEDSMDVDTQVPVSQNETPQIQRNKRLREGAMAAIAEMDVDEDEDESRGRGRGRGEGERDRSRSSHRRKSSVSRGKRISTSFEATGVITQPHNTVSESSFYKHIDADLPDVERIRQLLIWCSLRAANSYTKAPPPPATPGPSSSYSAPPSTSSSTSTLPAPTLPPLSAEAQAALKTMQDTFVRHLAEKKVDLFGGVRDGAGKDAANTNGTDQLRENEQNVRNRKWEVTYSSHIQRAQTEDEAWKQVSYEYDAYCKRLSSSLDKRKKAFLDQGGTLSTSTPGKGKGRATADGNEGDEDATGADGMTEEEERWLASFPQPHHLPPAFQRGAQLARTVLVQNRRRTLHPHPHPSTSTSTSTSAHQPHSHPRNSLSTPSPDLDLETTLLAKLPALTFKLDLLHTYAHAARAATNMCERTLDERYRLLNRNLDLRMRSASVPLGGGGAGPTGKKGAKQQDPTTNSRSHVLTAYVKRPYSPTRTLYPSSTITTSRAQSVPPPPPPLPSVSHLPSPHTLLRALSRVDASRPPAQIGDAARRAAREAQRAEQSGQPAIAGDRRVTLLPSMMPAGLGAPGTPRRGGGSGIPTTPGRRERTPARERTPGRERTPVRDR
ncbi:hypothetical protein FA15DRAFT_665933 [Coprinopsis marcescibilis]|uniref:Uncharacterized protein n=1 Tax=Coprinopsis marcescibilis TaxID=230819 RepID=A0A5C3LHB4_COPMA|nr:hypothetical protein FA15DRAFT_665933 [Coprinopsis marcescibilis]